MIRQVPLCYKYQLHMSVTRQSVQEGIMHNSTKIRLLDMFTKACEENDVKTVELLFPFVNITMGN